MMSAYNTLLKKKKEKKKEEQPPAHWYIGKHTRIVGGSGTLAKAIWVAKSQQQLLEWNDRDA